MLFGAWTLVEDGCCERLVILGSLVFCSKSAYSLEVVAEESGPSGESALVALDGQIASGELDRHVARSGGVVSSALGQ